MQNEYFLDTHFPKSLGPEIGEYAREVVFRDSRYIFTWRLGRSQFGFCTHCKQQYMTEDLRHNKTAFCPKCLSCCTVKSSGMGRKRMIDEAYFVYYQKSVRDPQVVIARGIYAVRDYRKDYEMVKTKLKVIAEYVFAQGGSAMRSRYAYYMNNGQISIGDWKRAYNVHSLFTKDHISHIPAFVSYDSIREAIQDTPFQYSTWDSYNSAHNKDLTEFFSLYAKYPCIEYLTKLGFDGLVQSKLDGRPTYSVINWRGKDLFKVLKVSKQEFIEIKKNVADVDYYFLKVFQTSKKKKWGLSIVEILAFINKYGSYHFDDLSKLADYSSIKKLTNYIEKQLQLDSKRGKNKHFYTWNYVLDAYRDYVADCKLLGLDLTHGHVVFPKNLYQAHQNTIKRVKVKNDQETNTKILARALSLQKYCFECKGLLIRPVASFEELITEGNTLKHCVATHYAQNHADGKTNILLIRKVSEPAKPYFTLELRDNRIVQVHGLKNCNPDQRVKAFLEAFESKKLKKQVKKQDLKTA